MIILFMFDNNRICREKKVILYVFRSSKMYRQSAMPHLVRIEALAKREIRNTKDVSEYCPYRIIMQYLKIRPKK